MKAHIAKHLEAFAKNRVEYLSEIIESEVSEVRISVVRPYDKIPVKFRLRHKPQGWMIYDMVIDDVSLVSNFRT